MEKAPWPAQVRGRQPTKKYYRARSSPTRGALLLIVGEFLEDALGDALERVEHAVAAHRHGREARELLGVELLLQLLDGNDVVHVALVVLHDEGHVLEVEFVLFEVVVKVVETLDVGVVTRR